MQCPSPLFPPHLYCFPTRNTTSPPPPHICIVFPRPTRSTYWHYHPLSTPGRLIRLPNMAAKSAGWRENIYGYIRNLSINYLPEMTLKKCKWQCHWCLCFPKDIIDFTIKKMTFEWFYWRWISMVIAQMKRRIIKMNIRLRDVLPEMLLHCRE